MMEEVLELLATDSPNDDNSVALSSGNNSNGSVGIRLRLDQRHESRQRRKLRDLARGGVSDRESIVLKRPLRKEDEGGILLGAWPRAAGQAEVQEQTQIAEAALGEGQRLSSMYATPASQHGCLCANLERLFFPEEVATTSFGDHQPDEFFCFVLHLVVGACWELGPNLRRGER